MDCPCDHPDPACAARHPEERAQASFGARPDSRGRAAPPREDRPRSRRTVASASPEHRARRNRETPQQTTTGRQSETTLRTASGKHAPRRRAEPSRAVPSRDEQCRAEPRRAAQSVLAHRQDTTTAESALHRPTGTGTRFAPRQRDSTPLYATPRAGLALAGRRRRRRARPADRPLRPLQEKLRKLLAGHKSGARRARDRTNPISWNRWVHSSRSSDVRIGDQYAAALTILFVYNPSAAHEALEVSERLHDQGQEVEKVSGAWTVLLI
jgi:hypothetical protein